MWSIFRRLKQPRTRWSLWKRAVLLFVGLCITIQLAFVGSLWREHQFRQQLEKRAQIQLGPSPWPAPLESQLRHWIGYKRMRLFAPIIGVDLSRPTESDFRNAAQLTHLRSLEISLGRTSATDLERLKGLRHLETLSLYYTDLDDNTLAGLSAWPNLRRIRLVGEVSPAALEPLKNCESLSELHLNDAYSYDDGDNYDIGECPYSGAHLAAIAKIPHLKLIKIAGTLRDTELRNLADAMELETLIVCHLQMETDAINSLGKLPRLEQLFVEPKYNFDPFEPQPLEGFPALKAFSISNSRISPAFVASLAKLPKLEALQISRSAIGEHAAGLGDLPNLKIMDLTTTYVKLSDLRKNGHSFESCLLFIDELMYPAGGLAVVYKTKPSDHFPRPRWPEIYATYGAGLRW